MFDNGKYSPTANTVMPLAEQRTGRLPWAMAWGRFAEGIPEQTAYPTE